MTDMDRRYVLRQGVLGGDRCCVWGLQELYGKPPCVETLMALVAAHANITEDGDHALVKRQ